MVHNLKILKQYYDRIVEGSKTYEIRLNDRFYQKGDEVTFTVFDPVFKQYDTTFPRIFAYIGDIYQLDNNQIVFSLLNVRVV